MTELFGKIVSTDNLATASIVEMLPSINGRNDEVPSDLKGAVIIKIGTFQQAGLVETNGLVVDYRPTGSSTVRRLVFAFNDQGMWVAENTVVGRFDVSGSPGEVSCD